MTSYKFLNGAVIFLVALFLTFLGATSFFTTESYAAEEGTCGLVIMACDEGTVYYCWDAG